MPLQIQYNRPTPEMQYYKTVYNTLQ